MGRSPCCDKAGLKKGPWTPEEDQKLLAYIEKHGHGSWRGLPAKAGLQRCGKSCRLRWSNYLRPDIKRGKFTLQEEQTIVQLHALLGNRWSAIATHLPKRTDNEIKNYWNTHLKKRLAKMGIDDPITHKPKSDALMLSGDDKNAANLSHMAQWESARLEAEARLVRQSKLRSAPSSVQAPQAGPTHCLDVLKAWIGGGGDTWATGGDLESPTSAMGSAAGVTAETRCWNFTDVNSNVDDDLQQDYWNNDSIQSLMKTSSLLSSSPHTWDDSSGTVNGGDSDDNNNASFVENFTDHLLLSGNNKTANTIPSIADGGSNNGTVDCFEEGDKNYWDSILNLATSPEF